MDTMIEQKLAAQISFDDFVKKHEKTLIKVNDWKCLRKTLERKKKSLTWRHSIHSLLLEGILNINSQSELDYSIR